MSLDSAAKSVTNFSNVVRNPATRTVNATQRADDFSEGLRFQELADPKEMIVLAGSWMPKDKLAFGGEQKINKTFYPGNSEPVIHVVGAEEDDITIMGRFCDKNLPANTEKDLYGVAYELSKKIDALRRRGSVLRLWLGEFQRYGILTKSNFELKRLGDINYSLTFAIAGFELPSNYRYLGDSKAIPYEVNNELIDRAKFWQQSHSRIPTEVPASIGDILRAAISDVATAVKLVTDAVDAVVSTVEDIAGAVNRLAGLIRYAINFIQTIKLRLGKLAFQVQQSFTFGSTSYAGSVPNPIVASQKTAAAVASTLSGANSLQALLAELRERFKEMAKTVPDRRHLVADGDTLQKLAVRYYSSVDEWKRIYDHNKLSSTALVSGTVLEIPKL